jgi:hypothetical protein
MADFFIWLSGGSFSSILFIIIVSIIGLSIPIAVIIATIQGREIYFYPPKIGDRKEEGAKRKSSTPRAQDELHFHCLQNRDEFNRLGISILNKAVLGDTVYTILRTGRFIEDFATALKDFCQKDSRLIVIVPNSRVFLAHRGYGDMLKSLITQLYENPSCEGQRGLVLDPGIGNPSETRMRGYFFVSDGNNTEIDGGFSTETYISSKFLLEYCKMLIETGRQIKSDEISSFSQ